MAKAKKETIITKTTQKLLDMLGIQAEFDVEAGEDHTDIILKTDEGGILIGYHGETLEALQLVLSLCVAKEVGEFSRISVEVGDYKKNRTEYLEQLVDELKQRALSEGHAVTLPNLKAWERRVVHMLLAEDTEVVSESSGEGRDRILEIRPK
jgi:spoIIIJ-associated protein